MKRLHLGWDRVIEGAIQCTVRYLQGRDCTRLYRPICFRYIRSPKREWLLKLLGNSIALTR